VADRVLAAIARSHLRHDQSPAPRTLPVPAVTLTDTPPRRKAG